MGREGGAATGFGPECAKARGGGLKAGRVCALLRRCCGLVAGREFRLGVIAAACACVELGEAFDIPARAEPKAEVEDVPELEVEGFRSLWRGLADGRFAAVGFGSVLFGGAVIEDRALLEPLCDFARAGDLPTVRDEFTRGGGWKRRPLSVFADFVSSLRDPRDGAFRVSHSEPRCEASSVFPS